MTRASGTAIRSSAPMTEAIAPPPRRLPLCPSRQKKEGATAQQAGLATAGVMRASPRTIATRPSAKTTAAIVRRCRRRCCRHRSPPQVRAPRTRRLACQHTATAIRLGTTMAWAHAHLRDHFPHGYSPIACGRAGMPPMPPMCACDLSLLNNGACDASCNTPLCEYDKGDCLDLPKPPAAPGTVCLDDSGEGCPWYTSDGHCDE